MSRMNSTSVSLLDLHATSIKRGTRRSSHPVTLEYIYPNIVSVLHWPFCSFSLGCHHSYNSNWMPANSICKASTTEQNLHASVASLRQHNHLLIHIHMFVNKWKEGAGNHHWFVHPWAAHAFGHASRDPARIFTRTERGVWLIRLLELCLDCHWHVPIGILVTQPVSTPTTIFPTTNE